MFENWLCLRRRSASSARSSRAPGAGRRPRGGQRARTPRALPTPAPTRPFIAVYLQEAGQLEGHAPAPGPAASPQTSGPRRGRRRQGAPPELKTPATSAAPPVSSGPGALVSCAPSHPAWPGTHESPAAHERGDPHCSFNHPFSINNLMSSSEQQHKLDFKAYEQALQYSPYGSALPASLPLGGASVATRSPLSPQPWSQPTTKVCIQTRSKHFLAPWDRGLSGMAMLVAGEREINSKQSHTYQADSSIMKSQLFLFPFLCVCTIFPPSAKRLLLCYCCSKRLVYIITKKTNLRPKKSCPLRI